ncbi:MAG TPA: hypothetical protein VM889_07690 [Candidatus Thermoplasmatota archaeon]|nr:hypothetical protein [Candidatus Thermoplasmatota archaeon]
MGQVRAFRLGELTIVGDQMTFTPSDRPDYEAEHGEEAEIGIAYRYSEDSPLKETCRIALALDFEGRPRERAEVLLQDRPGLSDHEWGFLVGRARFPTRGNVLGTFTLEAYYRKENWTGGAPAGTADFHRAGRFVVRVK